MGNLYVEIFRNVPLIVQMFLWFFVVPELLPKGLGDWIKQMPPPWSSYLPAVLCLGIFTSVRVAEQVRAGINSLPRGQRMAGIAMGLTETQTYLTVTLPQAFRIILPPLTSEFMNVIKNSSVALTIGLLALTALAMAGGIVFGTLLAMMRLSSIKPVAMLAGAYVNLMRSIPLVLVIFWFFFLVPYIGAWVIGAKEPIKVGAFLSAAITFTMFEAAYYCEIMRAGIQSIPPGQVWSGYALGLDYWQTMARIVLPQAFRNMLPVLLTQTIILFQDTSLVSVISATDLLGSAAKVANRDYRLVEMYTFVAVVYFVVSYSLSLLVKQLQDRIAIIR